MLVRDVMTRRPLAVTRSATLGSVIKALAARSVTGCPVVDSRRRVVGMVTQRDILSLLDVRDGINRREAMPLILAAIRGSSFAELKARMKPLRDKRIEEIMTRRVVAATEDQLLYDALSLLNKHNISRLPVLRNGRLVGVLSRSDVIKALK